MSLTSLPGRTAAAVVLSTAAALAAPPAAPAADAGALEGAVFTATAPEGWTVRRERDTTARYFGLTSKGKLDNVGIPAKGRLGITILEHRLGVLNLPPGQTARSIRDHVVGVPSAASNVRRVASGTVRIDGRSAATVTYTYRYRGRRIRQFDIVALVYGRVVFLETNTDQSRADAGLRANRELRSTWKWQRPG